jgi:hypothetical protein
MTKMIRLAQWSKIFVILHKKLFGGLPRGVGNPALGAKKAFRFFIVES